MKKLLILLLTIHNLSISVSAQQQKIDSLLLILKSVKEDTAKVNTLNLLSRQYWKKNDLDSASQYAGAALHLSLKNKFLKGEADADNNLGTILYFQSNYPEATKTYSAALELYKKLNDNKGAAVQYNNLGIVSGATGEYDIAIKYYTASVELKRKLGDKSGEADLINNIGVIYNYLGNYPEAMKNYYAALKVYEDQGSKKEIANAFINIGIIVRKQGNNDDALKNYIKALNLYKEIDYKKGIAVAYLNLGTVCEQQHDYINALKYYEEALKINNDMKDEQAAATSYSNIGIIYYDINNYLEALKNYLISLKIRTEIGDNDGLASCYINLGTLYLDMKNYEEAEKFLNKSLTLSKELGSKDAIRDSYNGLFKLNELLGNYKLALENYKHYVIYRDSLNNEENTKKIVQTQMQFEFDKKEATTKAEQEKKDAIALKELQRQKLIRNGFVGGFAVVLLFAGVFFTQRNKIKKGKKRSDELLLNILPEEVAEELKATGATTAKDFQEVTVLFTDFKNFTAMSEKLSAQELVNEINYCYSAFDNIITKHGIEKIKTIGDSYMCAGGLPVANKTNAIDTVAAAIEIRDFMLNEKLKREAAGPDASGFEIRIGCNTGSVVAGIVGVKKFAYDIWGDTVNIASRMESSGEAGKVNISGSTYELVKDKFNCIHRGKIEAKNKGMINMYFVESSKDY